MFYLIDYDTLDILFQHAKKTVLKAYVKDNGLTLSTEIINSSSDLTCFLTMQEMMTMYENITLESISKHYNDDVIADKLLSAIADETYPEPTGKATPPEETVKPDPKPHIKIKPSELAGLIFSKTEKKTREGTVFGVITTAILDNMGEATFEQIHEYFMGNYVAAKTGKTPTVNFANISIRDAVKMGIIYEIDEEL